MKAHANIPIFIPHEGCTHACIFCDQRAITGVRERADRDIRPEIDRALAHLSLPAESIQIAFFGGSFTGIDRAVMVRLLEDAYAYVKRGLVDSIRLSTRPDYISEEILDILKSHGVKSIELGLQSLRDPVLTRARRGHTAACAAYACKLIRSYGFELVGQMMLGLPGSSPEDEVYTAEQIVALSCDAARIYPTVVFENTELCRMAKAGVYVPLSVSEAATRGAAVLDVFVQSRVRVLRIGLQKNEADGLVYGGAHHSAMGELVESAYYARKIERECQALGLLAHPPAHITLFCAPGEESKVAGQNKENKRQLCKRLYGNESEMRRIRIQKEPALAVYTLRVQTEPFTENDHKGRNLICT